LLSPSGSFASLRTLGASLYLNLIWNGQDMINVEGAFVGPWDQPVRTK
jgi:hypothetical protein